MSSAALCRGFKPRQKVGSLATGILPTPRTRGAPARDTSYAIENLTTVAGLVAGTEPLQARAIRLDAVVKDALSGRIGANPVETDLVPAEVDGHSGLLRRAVLNLTENAIRHGRPDEGSPRVVVTVRSGSSR